MKLSFEQKEFFSKLIELEKEQKAKLIALIAQTTSLEHDSREVKNGSAFLCLPGATHHGLNFINQVIKKASLVLVDAKHASKVKAGLNNRAGEKRSEGSIGLKGKDNEKVSEKVFFIAKLEEIYPELTLAYYDWPSRRLKLIGITGTNGKTSSSYILSKFYQVAGYQTGIIGTLGIEINNRNYPTLNTTPHLVGLQKSLSQMVKKKTKVVMMEVSSHALVLGRAYGLEFDSIIWTNLTPEHLDFHKSMREYFKAKAKVFELLERSCKKNKKAFINYESLKDYSIKKYLLKYKTFETFYLKSAQNKRQIDEVESFCFTYQIKENNLFVLESGLTKKEYLTNLIGEGNGENLAFSLMEMLQSNIIPTLEKQLVEKRKRASIDHKLTLPMVNIPGRLERVELKKEWLKGLADLRENHLKENPDIFIDYAHTPNALEKLLATFKKMGFKIICIFGCGGDRDKEKRSLMGQIASQRAELVILTSDNPRHEDPLAIIEEIESGMEGLEELVDAHQQNLKKIIEQKFYLKEVNRKKAIYLGIDLWLKALQLQEKIVLLIAGKGHESYQVIGERVIPFSDKEVVKSFFQRFSAFSSGEEYSSS